MSPSPDPFDSFLGECREAWRRANVAAAELETMEERRRIRFAECFQEAGDMPAAKAEQFARRHDAYRDLCEDLANKRIEAAQTKATADWYTARLEVWRTREASARARRG